MRSQQDQCIEVNPVPLPQPDDQTISLFTSCESQSLHEPPGDESGRSSSSDEAQEHFFVQFSKSKGPPQIALIMILLAIGMGSTIGVVPAVMSERFARLEHGYMDPAACTSFSVVEKPAACFAGSADAQSAVAASNLLSNVFTFLATSLVGSFSDQYGRKGLLIFGLCIGTVSPLLLYLTQVIPSMSPWWYYGWKAISGLVNWMAIAISALADVLPHRLRAPSIGLLISGFMLGFALAPLLAFVFSNVHLPLINFIFVLLGLIATVFFVPETLPPPVAAEARRKRQLEAEQHEQMERDSPRRWTNKVLRILLLPLKEMSILNRDSFFRLISLLAFFSGIVSSGDQVLLVYYIEERLEFTTRDVSIVFFIIGVMGLLVQGFLLKPLNDLVGEKIVVSIAFLFGAINNTMYGTARNKSTIYAAVALSSLSAMAFPTISAIKANNVHETEQGRIQGALYSLQALASGTGPLLLRHVYSLTQDTALGPGTMFVVAGMLYMLASSLACLLPRDRADSRQTQYPPIDEGFESQQPLMPESEETFSYGSTR